METWRLYTYDVWGNAEEGYEVNDVYRTSDTLELPTDDPTGTPLGPNELCAFMRNAWLNARVVGPAHLLDIDLSQDDVIYINDAKTAKPLAELRREAQS